MSKQSERNAIRALVAKMRWLYETEQGSLFYGCPVSQLPQVLRDDGRRVVRRWDADEAGLEIVDARYVGGVRPKRFCRVVVAQRCAFNLAFHDFMRSIGAKHTFFEASWEDVGDAENGPELSGHGAYDAYVLDGIEYAVSEDGTVDRAPEAPPESCYDPNERRDVNGRTL